MSSIPTVSVVPVPRQCPHETLLPLDSRSAQKNKKKEIHLILHIGAVSHCEERKETQEKTKFPGRNNSPARLRSPSLSPHANMPS